MTNVIFINHVSETFLKTVKVMMKKKGYTFKVKKYSALYECTYSKDGFEISVCGWHGDGKYGIIKNVMDIFTNQNQMTRLPLFDKEIIGGIIDEHSSLKEIENYCIDMSKAVEWINQNA